MDEKNPEYWKISGNDYFNNGQYEEAAKCYSRAIELNSNYIEAWNNLGYTLQKVGRIEEAKQCNLKVKELKRAQVSASSSIITNSTPNLILKQKYENGEISLNEYIESSGIKEIKNETIQDNKKVTSYNYRKLFNEFSLAILAINLLYSLIPIFDPEGLFLIIILFVFLYIFRYKFENANLLFIFEIALIIYLIIGIIPNFILGRFNIPNTSGEIASLAGSLTASTLKQTFAIGLIILGILTIYFRSTWLFSKREKDHRQKLVDLKIKWKQYPIFILCLIISLVVLFFIIFLVPGIIDVGYIDNIILNPATYCLFYIVPVYYCSIFLFQKMNDKLI